MVKTGQTMTTILLNSGNRNQSVKGTLELTLYLSMEYCEEDLDRSKLYFS